MNDQNQTMPLFRVFLCSGVIALGCGAKLHADTEEVKGLTIRDIKHQDYWGGAELRSKTLKGKVVLLKIWGG